MSSKAEIFFEGETWSDDAKCGELSQKEFGRLFYHEGIDGSDSRKVPAVNAEAKAICKACPAKGPCLENAITTDDIHVGVRGAMSPLELQGEKTKRRREQGITTRQKSNSTVILDSSRRDKRK